MDVKLGKVEPFTQQGTVTMARYSAILAMLLAFARPASANGLFDELSRDFGAVPRGPLLSHPFRIVNTTGQTITIHSVRVSCGCVTARALQNSLKPGEDSAVVVTMDTTRFIGNKGVNVWVMVAHPHLEEIRLWVQANSRDDVVLTPEGLNFGKILRGTTPVTNVNVSFFGNPGLDVTEVRCDSNYLQPSCKVVRRDMGEVAYQLSATLRHDTPAGKWFTDVWLKTNNPAMPKVRVPLAVEIEKTAVVPAATIALGQVKLGGETTHKLVIRGGQPFRITRIAGTDAQIQIRDSAPDGDKAHVLIVTFRPEAAGEFSRTLKIYTDLQTNGELEFNAQAQVISN
jgi:hypothetical protein